MNNEHASAEIASNAVKIRDGFNYFKAVFGFRPRLATRSLDTWQDECIAAYDAADAEMKKRKATVKGRNKLRNEGWVLDGDPSPDYRETES